MEVVVAVGVPSFEDGHELGVRGNGTLACDSRRAILEDGLGPRQLLGVGEVFGIVDELGLPFPLAEVSLTIEGWGFDFELGPSLRRGPDLLR